jgi:nucleoside-diphosphate-sugar epimerase
VRALTREGSGRGLPAGVDIVLGDALRAETFAHAIAPGGLPATVLRPWYVVGPGHWWPVVLYPLYAVGEWLPATRAGARRLGLVTLAQLVAALVHAVEHPPGGVRLVDVPAIRAG